MDQTSRFRPKRGLGPEARLKHLEDFVARLAIPEASIVSAGPGGTSLSGGGTPAPEPLGRIPESQVIFDATSGHQHEGTASHLITLLGDVTGTNAAAAVGKLQGHAVPAPAAGDDQKFVKYDNGSGAFVYSAQPGTALGKHVLGAWAKGDLSLLTGSDTELANAWSKGADDHIYRRMSGAGTLKSLTVVLNTAITGGGSAIFTVYKNGSATALTLTVSGASVDGEANIDVAFADADHITVMGQKSGTISNTPFVTVTVEGIYT